MKITYTRAPEYRLTAANGVWGGATPAGDVVFDLYMERIGLPDDQDVRPPDASGKSEGSEALKFSYVSRESQVGLVLTPEAALAIGAWLQNYGAVALGNRNKAAMQNPPEAPK